MFSVMMSLESGQRSSRHRHIDAIEQGALAGTFGGEMWDGFWCTAHGGFLTRRRRSCGSFVVLAVGD